MLKLRRIFISSGSHLQRCCFGFALPADQLNTNKTTLKQAFREIMKTTIYAYFQKRRMNIVIRMMKEGYTIGGISGRVGYSETGHFSYAFKKMYGIPPSRYAKPLLEEMDIHNYSS